MAPVLPALLPVVFVSSWAEGEVRTSAWLDLDLGQVIDIEVSNEGDEYENLLGEYVESIDGSVLARLGQVDPSGHYALDTDALSAFARWHARPKPR